MSKSQKITLSIVFTLFVLVFAVLTIWYFGGNYDEFYAIATQEFAIPGLSEGFTPQGIAYDNKTSRFLICGYMKNGSASRIYVINNKKTEKYFTLALDGKAYNGHAGGIATNGVKVWISGDGQVHCFNFADIDNVQNTEIIDIQSSFNSQNGADFVTVEDAYLWVGEFHRNGKYDTPKSHTIETPSKKTNKAVSFKYVIDNEQDTGITENNTPIAALSTPSLVQGMVVHGNKVVISTSYSLPDSHIYTYEIDTNASVTETFEFDETTIPLYVLDDKDLKNDLTAPCMSEEIVYAKGKVYVLFESACQKYNLFTREQLRNVYSFKI